MEENSTLISAMAMTMSVDLACQMPSAAFRCFAAFLSRMMAHVNHVARDGLTNLTSQAVSNASCTCPVMVVGGMHLCAPFRSGSKALHDTSKTQSLGRRAFNPAIHLSKDPYLREF